MKIAVIGPVFADIKGYPESTYLSDGRNSGRIEYVHGGVSRNIAEDLANVGEEPVLLSLVDESGLGSEILAHLTEVGVDTSFMRAVKDGMGTWMAIFNNDGDVVANIAKRPDIRPLADILDENETVFDICKAVSLEIDTHEEIVAKTFELAEKHGCDVYAVISNMGIAMERRAYFPRLKCLVCNLQEMGMLFGDELRKVYEVPAGGEPVQNGPESASSENSDKLLQKSRALMLAKALLERIRRENISGMFVTLGAGGAVYADAKSGGFGFVPAEKVKVVDTTGAGDAFFSGIAASLSNGKSFEEAGRFASRMSASVIQSFANVCGKIGSP